MPNLPVIYLAAGRGSRLGDLCAQRPKALVEAGGRTLAERAFEYLSAAGFERIVAVTGHAADRLEGLGAETVFNDRWSDENNIVSLWQVREIVRGGCVIVNCDLLFEPELARRLADTEGSALLVDDVLEVDQESMKVTLGPSGDLARLHKSIPLTEAIGEYIGLTRVDPADGPLLAEILDEFIAAGNVQVYYEDALEELARRRAVRVERVGGLLWVEIDDHDDLARANDEIAPAIDALTPQPSATVLETSA
ncbi:MAG: phosphocholine cytidylyltransferase family protein [Actinobacteria bacterium]|nr:phosphocholine cytidylyltransferase family protein [Actinomycetota bacterium]